MTFRTLAYLEAKAKGDNSMPKKAVKPEGRYGEAPQVLYAW
jgi:hypothetical protein